MNHKDHILPKTMTEATGKTRTDASLNPAFGGEHVIEKYQIANMHCGSCVSRIENALNALPGVTSVRVDFKSRSVDIEYLEGAAFPADFRLAIESTGHQVADRLPL